MSTSNQKTVVVGMSGGVDSSVAALLLKQQGFNVIGMFMKNWQEEDEFGVCKASIEYEDVVKVCERIGIAYYSVDFVKEYRDNVFSHFLSEYEQGHTPNPDILCNREIKFKVFFKKAMELGADFLATGHYCQNLKINNTSMLVKGNDPGKDQTYFLYTIKSKVLDKVLFPIGHLPKSEVRKIAKENNLITHDKKDSTGICFIGERNFKQFLSNYISIKPGAFKNLKGEVVGTHDGCAYYTLGQRKGLGLGGQGEPWFVVAKNTSLNEVIVERGEFHPALFCDYLWATDLEFTHESLIPKVGQKLWAKVRYRQQDQECVVEEITKDSVKVSFKAPQRAVTVRQSIVFFDKIQNEMVCLGGAMIRESGPSYFEMKKELDLTNLKED